MSTPREPRLGECWKLGKRRLHVIIKDVWRGTDRRQYVALRHRATGEEEPALLIAFLKLAVPCSAHPPETPC